MKDLFAWTTIVVFLAVGIYLLVRARQMQKRAIEAGKGLKFNPFGRYIKSETYVTVTRISGAITILVAILITVLMIWRD